MMPKFPSTLKAPVYWLVLAALLYGACLNQSGFTIKPLFRQRRTIISDFRRNEAQKLAAFRPDIVKGVNFIGAFPSDTRFYFVPCFADSGNATIGWWYAYVLIRYLSYPRIILCHDKVLYDDKKELYLARFIGGAGTWGELDWIRSRDIKFIILLRNDRARFLPVTAPITGI